MSWCNARHLEAAFIGAAAAVVDAGTSELSSSSLSSPPAGRLASSALPKSTEHRQGPTITTTKFFSTDSFWQGRRDGGRSAADRGACCGARLAIASSFVGSRAQNYQLQPALAAVYAVVQSTSQLTKLKLQCTSDLLLSSPSRRQGSAKLGQFFFSVCLKELTLWAVDVRVLD